MTDYQERRDSMARGFASVINAHSGENDSNTSDWILGEYLLGCLDAFNDGVMKRAKWYGRLDVPGGGWETPPA